MLAYFRPYFLYLFWGRDLHSAMASITYVSWID